MKRFLKSTCFLLLLIAIKSSSSAQTTIAQTYSSVGEIIYPYRSTPAIVKSGTGFFILYNNRQGHAIDSVQLKAKYWKVKLKIDSVQRGHFEYDTYTTQYTNTKIWVSVAAGSAEDVYDLVVYSKGEGHVSSRSVKLVKTFSVKQTIIHISDTHVSRNWVGPLTNGYAKELELLDKFINVANIIAPDFVIITGDLIHNYTRTNEDARGWGGKLETKGEPSAEEKFRNYYEGAKGYRGVQAMDAPVFSITGNHDFYGMKENDHPSKSLQWNTISGLRVRGVAYGDTRFMFADDYLGDSLVDIPAKKSMSGLQGKVFEKFLETNGAGKIRIMAQHKHDRFDTTFINKNHISLVLTGHNHTPGVDKIKNTSILSMRPGVVCRSGENERWEKVLGFFRLVTINGSEYTYSEPLRFCVNPTVPYKAIKLNLSLTYKLDNTGKSKSNQAVIKNSLPTDLPNCHIRFVMKKGKYKVNGGRVQQVVNSGALTIVDVRADVKINSSKLVTIAAE